MEEIVKETMGVEHVGSYTYITRGREFILSVVGDCNIFKLRSDMMWSIALKFPPAASGKIELQNGSNVKYLLCAS